MTPRSSVAPLTAALLLTLAAPAPDARGQGGPSGSASATALAQGLGPAGGDKAASASAQTEGALPGSLGGEVMTSSSYSLQVGVVWTEPALGTDAPIVLSVDPPDGFHAGGEPVIVRGLNFQALGAGSAAVTFGGVPAGAALVTSGTEISVTTPPAHDALGNPLGSTRVEVTNGNGTGGADDAFLVYPALRQATEAQLGKATTIDMRMKPFSTIFLFVGIATPAAAAPIFPFDGKLAIVFSPILALNGLTLPISHLPLAFDLPDNPAFAGVGIDLQMLAVESPTAGSFSNVLHVTLHP